MKYVKTLAFSALVLSALVAQACGGDNPEPDKDGDKDGDDTYVPPEGGSPGDGNGTGGNNGVGGEDGNGTGGFAPPPERPDCPTTANGTQPVTSDIPGTACWDISECNGVKPEQFLERCNGGNCYPFDNEDRIEGYTGTLPPL
jgi:hypothetical protein